MAGQHELKAFYELWKKGFRFLPENVEDDMHYCLSREVAPGQYEVLTIRGMKEMAKEGRLTLDGVALTPEEVELFWNLAAFIKMERKKKRA